MGSLPPWFSSFCDLGSDRLQVLVRVLHAAGLPVELVKTGDHRHVQVRAGRPPVPVPGEKVLVAHYDRVPGAPGANDNGASVLALVDYLRRPRRGAALRVVFTDGEELGPGASASDQGAFSLATHWGPIAGVVPVVFDMTGIGDTLVLGHLGEHLVRRTGAVSTPTDLDTYARNRLVARRWLASCGAGDTLEVNTPFSDDLGFSLAGMPAVQVSLLPRKEALAYRRTRTNPGELEGRDPGGLPPSWQTMHTPDDTPDRLWPSSRDLMARVLDRLEGFPF
jgi:hypothetical protein